jgi:hypothetical protein
MNRKDCIVDYGGQARVSLVYPEKEMNPQPTLFWTIIDRPHPEKRPGEIYVFNKFVDSPHPGFKTVRLGNIAYDIYGSIIDDIPAPRPVFVRYDELIELSYKVYAPYWEKKGEVQWDGVSRIIPRSAMLERYSALLPHTSGDSAPLIAVGHSHLEQRNGVVSVFDSGVDETPPETEYVGEVKPNEVDP